MAISPVLYRIVQGSSSTSLNLIKAAKKTAGKPQLFRKREFARTIIFKYPNFADPAMGGGRGQPERPIETAIYIPHNELEPMAGGYAIYLREAKASLLLQQYMGVNEDSQDPDLERDLRVLRAIDEMPSLDPFLLKARFEALGIDFEEESLDIREEEERAIRKLIETRIGRILAKAFGGAKGMPPEMVARIIDSIWDPTMPESTKFVEAFGINASDCPKVFFALQGITFYEYMFGNAMTSCRGVMEWLNGPAAKPVDIMMYPRYEQDRLQMLRQEVHKGMTGTLRALSDQFKTYDQALEEFVGKNNPVPIRNFLFAASATFWRLGQGITAALNAAAIIEDTQKPGSSSKFEGVVEVLMRLRVALSDRASSHAL
jgi:hypothetical protein